MQFYVTARCNLTCEQCNVIYANADQEEVTTDQCRRIAENLARIGTSVVLLTGGEPFVRRDIVSIAEAMSRIGAHDISISLDSVVPPMQDVINGGYDRSWEVAIRTMANVNELFPRDS